MTDKRFRLDTGVILDQEEGKILSTIKVRNRLNQQDKEIKELKEAMKRLMADLMTR